MSLLELIPTRLPEVIIAKPRYFGDDRGWFTETFNEKRFHDALRAIGQPVPRPFVQDNHSCSQRGVLRGLHFQRPPHSQGKLVRVVKGRAFDVAVDIRKDSPRFGQWVGVELSAENRQQVWVPEGFAHGFVALEDDTHFLYKTTDYYAKDCEGAIVWNDPTIGIDWPLQGMTPSLADKDAAAPRLQDATVFKTTP
jgi:dTDP-4-dehydrorhamnose 3,5-epimerase